MIRPKKFHHDPNKLECINRNSLVVNRLLMRKSGFDTSRIYCFEIFVKIAETKAKHAVVARFVADTMPAMLWDLGCNSGDYSELALDNGAGHVVGWDFDLGALEAAFARSREKKLAFTTLYFDASNPSPDQGWAQSERRGMTERGPVDATLALALVHHLAITKNLPLARITAWLTGLGRSGVVEFVAKDDPMVQTLLTMREDIFPDYTLEAFLASLSTNAEIGHVEALGTRHLITYRTKL